jgi:hypothetical protein
VSRVRASSDCVARLQERWASQEEGEIGLVRANKNSGQRMRLNMGLGALRYSERPLTNHQGVRTYRLDRPGSG